MSGESSGKEFAPQANREVYFGVSQEGLPQSYPAWRRDLIKRDRLQRAERELGKIPSRHEVILPDTCAGLNVNVERGIVGFQTIDDLVSDMRRYFVPGIDGLPSAVLSRDKSTEAVGSENAASILNQFDPKGENETMDRLEKEMREWAATGHEGDYRDSRARMVPGDPYKYGGGMFTGMDIGVTNANGNYNLSLKGQGNSYNEFNATSAIEDFAAFSGKEVQYSGKMEVTYIPAPINIHKGEGNEGSATLSVSLKDITDHFGNVTGLTPEEKGRFINEATTRRKDDQSISDNGILVFHQRDGLTFSVDPLHRFDCGQFDGKTGVYTEDHLNSRHLRLPRITIGITGGNPAIHNLVTTFKAIKEIRGGDQVINYGDYSIDSESGMYQEIRRRGK